MVLSGVKIPPRGSMSEVRRCRKFVVDGLKGNRLGGKTRHDIGRMMGRAGTILHREGELGQSESPTLEATLGIRYIHNPA
jgi:hypothetical protein